MSFEHTDEPPKPYAKENFFGDDDVTNDDTPIEFDEVDNLIDDLIEQVSFIDGISLTNITDVDKQFEAEAAQEYNKILKDTTYNPAEDPEIDQAPTKKVRKPKIDKEHLKQLVSQCDLLGFPRKEAAEFITSVLNPNKDPDIAPFTERQYDSWLLKLRTHKQLFFEYYSRAGIFEDVYDVRATLKMVYQNLARQFRMEVLKSDKKDKVYIIKLAETLNTMSDEMMRVSMSSPFVQGFKSLMDYKNRIIDEVQRVHPNILNELGIKPLSSQLSLPATSGSAADGQSGNAETNTEGSVLEQPATKEEGSGDGEGDIQKPSITSGIPQTDRTTRNRFTERIF